MGNSNYSYLFTITGEMIAVDGMPSSTVMMTGFKALIKHLSPGYTFPSQAEFEESILTPIYEEIKQNVQQLLHTAVYISFSLQEERTDKRGGTTVTVTAYFIQHAKIMSVLLSKYHVTSNLLSGDTVEIVNRVMSEWELPLSKRYAVITKERSTSSGE